MKFRKVISYFTLIVSGGASLQAADAEIAFVGAGPINLMAGMDYEAQVTVTLPTGAVAAGVTIESVSLFDNSVLLVEMEYDNGIWKAPVPNINAGQHDFSVLVVDSEGEQTTRDSSSFDDSLRVNVLPLDLTIDFGSEGYAPGTGVALDTGLVLGNRSVTSPVAGDFFYGWTQSLNGYSDVAGSYSGLPASLDVAWDSYRRFRSSDGYEADWELQVPDGVYLVDLWLGDSSYGAEEYELLIERASTGTFKTKTETGYAGWHAQVTKVVQVEDGKLTLSDSGSVLPAKLNRLSIRQVFAPDENNLKFLSTFSYGYNSITFDSIWVSALGTQRGVSKPVRSLSGTIGEYIDYLDVLRDPWISEIKVFNAGRPFSSVSYYALGDLTDSASDLSLSASYWTRSVTGSFAYFGEQFGGSSLLQHVPYAFFVNPGTLGAISSTDSEMRIQVYSKADYSHEGTIEIDLDDLMIESGSLSENERNAILAGSTVEVEDYGLHTTLGLSRQFGDDAPEFMVWHRADRADYIYVVETNSSVDHTLSASATKTLSFDGTSLSLGADQFTPVYTLSFSEASRAGDSVEVQKNTAFGSSLLPFYLSGKGESGAATATQQNLSDTGLALSSTPREVIWYENFTGTTNGTMSDSGFTSWDTVQNLGIFSVQGERFQLSNTRGEVSWSSALFSVSDYDSMRIMLTVQSSGSLEEDGSDYLKFYYVLDDGDSSTVDPEISLGDAILGNFNQNIPDTLAFDVDSLAGAQVRFVIRGNLNSSSEHYYFDDIVVEGQQALSADLRMENPEQDKAVDLLARIYDANGSYAQNLSWFEDFNDLPNGSTVGSGDSIWGVTSGGGTFEVLDGRFLVSNTGNGSSPEWVSETINIAVHPSVAISLDIQSSGSLDGPDFIAGYFRVDSGPWERFFYENDNFNGNEVQSVQIEGLSGTDLELKVVAAASSSNEFYYFDNIRVYRTPATTDSLTPELRHHSVLDEFVAKHNFDPIALTNYVFNEIELIDELSYNQSPEPEISLDPGGVQRSALGVFLEKKGSPTEQCALLVYFLRRCGIPAGYASGERNQLILDTDLLSSILRINLRQYRDVPAQVPVNYPWVVALIDSSGGGANGEWVHLFPWLKDIEVEEGFDLFSLMPDNYNTAWEWVIGYFNANEEILPFQHNGESEPDKGEVLQVLGSLPEDLPSEYRALRYASDYDQPFALFPRFVEWKLREQGLEVNLDEDIGMQYRYRNNYYSRWQDFPEPSYFDGDVDVLAGLDEIPDIFDTLEYRLYGVTFDDDGNETSTGALIETGAINVCDLHNRKLIVQNLPQSAGSSTKEIALRMGAYDTSNRSGQLESWPLLSSSEGSDSFQTTAQKVDSGTQSHSLEDTVLHIRRRKNRPYVDLSGILDGLADTGDSIWSGFDDTRFREDTFDGARQKLDYEFVWYLDEGVYAVCNHFGSVSREMLALHGQELTEYERSDVSVESDTDIELDTRIYLMGMQYWEYTSRFKQEMARLLKVRYINDSGMMLAGLDVDEANNPVFPKVDIFQPTRFGYLLNGTFDLARNLPDVDVTRDFYHLVGCQGSAYEHGAINKYFGQLGAVSTMRVFHLAKNRGDTVYMITYQDWLDYENGISGNLIDSITIEHEKGDDPEPLIESSLFPEIQSFFEVREERFNSGQTDEANLLGSLIFLAPKYYEYYTGPTFRRECAGVAPVPYRGTMGGTIYQDGRIREYVVGNIAPNPADESQGRVEVSPSNYQSVPYQTKIRVWAIPKPGYGLENWSDGSGYEGSGNYRSIEVRNGPVPDLTANFLKQMERPTSATEGNGDLSRCFPPPRIIFPTRVSAFSPGDGVTNFRVERASVDSSGISSSVIYLGTSSGSAIIPHSGVVATTGDPNISRGSDMVIRRTKSGWLPSEWIYFGTRSASWASTTLCLTSLGQSTFATWENQYMGEITGFTGIPNPGFRFVGSTEISSNASHRVLEFEFGIDPDAE